MQDLIGFRLGPYQIISRVGSGGMTIVYKAYQANLERHVALKVLSPQYIRQPVILERFIQEVQIVSQLEHPHIVPMYDYGEDDGYFYIAMRLIETGSLYDRFHGQPFPLAQSRQVISQVGDALDYAHSQGIVHRDIKMKNILMDGRDNALLTDFGIAKVLQRDANLTQAGRTLGTPGYMAPEQIQGEPVDGRTDVYALGVLLYQLVTGRFPYSANSSQEVIMMHLYDPIPSARAFNPEIPESLDRIIHKALAKSPGDRYATAAEMVRAVQAATFDQVPTLVDEELSATLPSISVHVAAPSPPPEISTPAVIIPPASEDNEATSLLSLPEVEQPETGRPKRQSNLLVLMTGTIIILLVFIIGLILYFGPQIQSALTTLATNPTSAPPATLMPVVAAPPTATPQILWEELLAQPEIIQVAAADESDWLVFTEAVYQDFVLQVEMAQLEGRSDSYYGVTLREHEDGERYYGFEISGDGFWEFYKILGCPENEAEPCDYYLIRAGESESLRRQGTQQLQIEAIGPNFTFYLNGEKVEDVSDPDFTAGYIGLIVNSSASGGAEVSFNRLKIGVIE